MTAEVLDLASDDAWAWGGLDVPGTAGLGHTRTDALTTIIRAHDVSTVQVNWRHRDGGTRLAYYRLRPVIEHLDATLPGILAGLDAAALAATRRYRQWIRDGEDTEPAWHTSMCRHWRRAYLAAAGAAYAGQLRDAAHPPMITTTAHQQAGPAMGHHNAFEFAGDDALRLDPRPLRAANTVIAATSVAGQRTPSGCADQRPAAASDQRTPDPLRHRRMTCRRADANHRRHLAEHRTTINHAGGTRRQPRRHRSSAFRQETGC